MTEKDPSLKTRVGPYAKRVLGASACTLICGASGVLGMNTLGQTETTVGPATGNVGLHMSGNPHELFGLNGGTRVGLADMDTSFNTHSFGPSVEGSIKSIDLQSTKAAIGPTVTTGQLEQSMRRQVSDDLEHLEKQKKEIIARSLGAFTGGVLFSGALLQVLIWSSREKNRVSLKELVKDNASLGIAGSLIVGLGSSAITAGTYDPSQFASPQKSGAVASAEVLTKSSDKIRIADERNANSAVAVLSLINSIEAEAKLEEGIEEPSFRIIVISDNHMVDPSELVNNEIDQTSTPSVVIDLGDETNFGTTIENKIAKSWYGAINAPSYGVPGNHDEDPAEGESTLYSVKKGEVASLNIYGERVLAIGDPLYTPDPSVPIPENQLTRLEEVRAQVRDQLDAAAERGQPYDIIATHEEGLLDGIDVHGAGVLVGHSHKQETNFDEDGWLINPGTTGGAGLRRLQGPTRDSDEKAAPRSYTVLSIVASCQLSEVKQVSYSAGSSDDEYGVRQRINPEYDPELNDSDRCAV